MSDAQSIQQVLSLLDLRPLWTLLTSITPLQWTAVLIGPALHLAAPLLRRVWPSFGGGKFLYLVPLRKKLSAWTFWHWRAVSAFPILLALLFPGHSTAPLLLLGGASSLGLVLAIQRRVRSTVEVRDHAYRLNGEFCPYDTLLDVRKVDDGYELVAKKGIIVVTDAQYEVLRPVLYRVGVGGGLTSSSPLVSSGEFNLK